MTEVVLVVIAYGALCAIAGGSFTALVLWVFYGPFVRSERLRPLSPRDDVTDGLAHGDWPAIPQGVVALHRSGDRT